MKKHYHLTMILNGFLTIDTEFTRRADAKHELLQSAKQFGGSIDERTLENLMRMDGYIRVPVDRGFIALSSYEK